MISIEGCCLNEVYSLRSKLANTKERAKKTFKTVNDMLQVLNRHGVYGAVVFLEAYKNDTNELALLTAYNNILHGILPELLPSHLQTVSLDNLKAVKTWYGQHLCNDDETAAIAEDIFRRLLIHVRYETKANSKDQATGDTPQGTA